MPMPRNKPETIWQRVSNYGDPDECWEWQGSTRRGYGQIRIGHRYWFAHRLAFSLAKGDPGYLFVCHTCDNKKCCNPDHLFLGTHQDNMKDMVAKGRSPKTPSGAAHPQAKLNEEQVTRMRKLNAGGVSQRRLSKMFSISNQQVSRIIRGERWGHV